MAADKLEGEALTSCLRQLVVNCEPLLRDTSGIEQAEEILLHLEENDENFHKYEFVKALRQKLYQVMEPLIDEEELHLGRPINQSADLVDQITERILGSKEFKGLSEKLKVHVTGAVEYLIKNFDDEFAIRRSFPPDMNTNYHNKNSFSWSDGDSTFSSLQASIMFMNNEQFLLVCQNLDSRKDISQRREAMSKLCQMSSVDQSSDTWLILKPAVLGAVSDPDETLSSLALRFLAKGFSVTSPNIKDMYLTLCEFLKSYFQDKKMLHMPKIKDSYSMKTFDQIKLMKGFRLLNEFQNRIPQFWVRYSEKFLIDVLEATVSLLSIHNKGVAAEESRVTPIHFLAMFDARAAWLSRWLHGNYSRSPLIKIISKGKYKAMFAEAVKACIRFLEARKPEEVSVHDHKSRAAASSDTAGATGVAPSSARTGVKYTAAELDYLNFVHSFSFVTKLLCYSKGRALLPITDKENQITCHKIVHSMINFVLTYRKPASSKKTNFDPCILVMDALLRFSSNPQVCSSLMCNEEVMKLLMQPLISAISVSGKKHQRTSSQSNNDQVYVYVADILSLVVSSSQGLRFALSGDKKSDEVPPVHIIVQFIQQGIKGVIKVPTNVMIVFMYICRQIYSTPEGLASLRRFGLHDMIANTWREAMSDPELTAPTSAASGVQRSGSGRRKNALQLSYWEEHLKDNLLNFAATPRGVLLLEQTGAISDCVGHMCSRYIRKLQVSKCQKFGYGYMLTQLVCTAPGFNAVENSVGFISTLLQDVWNVLECRFDERPVFLPRPWPTDTIDKFTLKPLTNIFKLLSSFHSVYECFTQQTLPNKEEYSVREFPVDLVGLFDRLVIINSEAKSRVLFNLEHSSMFGLRLLGCITCCLDSMILLQCQFNFQQILLDNQFSIISEDNKTTQIYIDALTMERNYILVKCNVLGGPLERILPPRTLVDSQKWDYPFPMVKTLPVNEPCFFNDPWRQVVQPENSLQTFVDSCTEVGAQWIGKCRVAVLEAFSGKPNSLPVPLLSKILEKAMQILYETTRDLKKGFYMEQNQVDPAAVKKRVLEPYDVKGMELLLRYGIRLKALPGDESKTALSDLIKTVRTFFTAEQKIPSRSALKSLSGEYRAFDWFAGVTFLMFNGSLERSWKTLQNISVLPAAAYLWSHRLHNSMYLTAALRESGIPPLYYKVCQMVELLLTRESPEVASALRLSGFCVTQVIQTWLRQCFLNFLDWPAVVQYLSLVLVCGVDYQVYFCLAVLAHLEPHIISHQQKADLVFFLREEPIQGFQVNEHIARMQKLETRYRTSILQDLMDINIF